MTKEIVVIDRIIDTDGLLPAAVSSLSPAILFTKEHMTAAISALREKALEHKPDTSTDKGRKAIISNAAKLGKSITFLDNIGQHINDDKRAAIDATNLQRKLMRDDLKPLQKELRQPVTDWEKANTERVERITSTIEKIRLNGILDLPFNETPVHVMQAKLDAINSIEISDDFAEFKEMSESTKVNSVNYITHMISLREQYDKDQAELTRLKEAETKRLAKDAQDKEIADKAEREEKIRQQAKIDAEKLAAEKAKQVKIKAQEKIDDAKAATQRAEREKIEAVAAEKLKAEQRAKKVEDDRLAKIESDRKADEARAADEKNRGRIKDEIVDAILDFTPLTIAQKIADMAIAGQIPYTKVEF